MRFSQSSRNTFKNLLATIRTDAILYTMCLSLPGYVEHLNHTLVKNAFLRWKKRLVAKISRDSRFSSLCGLGKQELQRRLELHFHLLFAGVAPENLDVIWEWCVEQWIACVMDIPGMPPEIVEEETRKMRAVHMFSGTKKEKFQDSNFQLIRGDFHSYFAKYLGKDDEAHIATNPIPGRWWFTFNSEKIPFGELREIEMPERVCVHTHRVARRIRQVRADNARHRALCRKYDMLEDGKPLVSRQALLDCYQRLQSIGGKAALDAWDSGGSPEIARQVRKMVPHGDSAPLRLLLAAMAAGERLESLLGRFRFPPAMKYSGITLTGKHVPEMMVRILYYAGGRALEDRESTPF
jgi:hypothetical protein